MLRASRSTPPLVYFSLQPPSGGRLPPMNGIGICGSSPSGSGLSIGSRLRQSIPADAMPASFPPMPTVTRSVLFVSRLNCGGLAPPVGSPVCGLVKSSVVAEPQDASRNVLAPIAFATSLG